MNHLNIGQTNSSSQFLNVDSRDFENAIRLRWNPLVLVGGVVVWIGCFASTLYLAWRTYFDLASPYAQHQESVERCLITFSVLLILGLIALCSFACQTLLLSHESIVASGICSTVSMDIANLTEIVWIRRIQKHRGGTSICHRVRIRNSESKIEIELSNFSQASAELLIIYLRQKCSHQIQHQWKGFEESWRETHSSAKNAWMTHEEAGQGFCACIGSLSLTSMVLMKNHGVTLWAMVLAGASIIGIVFTAWQYCGPTRCRSDTRFE